MRTLLILVSTVSLFLTGCKTGTKGTSCGSSCGSSSVSCGSTSVNCCSTQIGAAAITDQKTKTAKTEETETIVEAAHVLDKTNPFENLEDLIPTEAEPEPEPQTKTVTTPEQAHAEDYGWLIGRLQRVHSPKHQWKIRYAAIDQHDEWGGSVVLAEDVRLDEWNDGDLVFVEGEILKERPSVYLSGPLYRVRSIHPISEVTFVVPRN